MNRNSAILTMRSAAGQWFFLNLQYEFEDAIAELSGASLLRIEELQKQGARRNLLGRMLSEFPYRVETLFVVAMTPERVWLDRLKNWRKMCGRVCVYLFDSWPTEHTLDLIKNSAINEVDVLYCSFAEGADFYQGKINPEVRYLPQGFDRRWFRPGIRERGIYCSAMARQDEPFLAGAMSWCEERDRLLIRSTDSGSFRRDWVDVQTQFASIIRHSRSSLCWSNSNRPNWERDYRIDPITTRHLQILASDTLYVGTPPATLAWKNWWAEDPCLDVRCFDRDPGLVFTFMDTNHDHLAERARRISDHVIRHHTWHHRAQVIVSEMNKTDV